MRRRFSLQCNVGLPDASARQAILHRMLEEHAGSMDVDAELLQVPHMSCCKTRQAQPSCPASETDYLSQDGYRVGQIKAELMHAPTIIFFKSTRRGNLFQFQGLWGITQH